MHTKAIDAIWDTALNKLAAELGLKHKHKHKLNKSILFDAGLSPRLDNSILSFAIYEPSLVFEHIFASHYFPMIKSKRKFL